MLIIIVMKKYLIATPGRTASTSLFNYIESSLLDTSSNVAAIDRGQYSSTEWEAFNHAEYAVFTSFNPFHMPNILTTIDTSEWCLIVLNREDIASWLLSINALNTTNNWHPGKDYKPDILTFEQDTFMSSYWFYKCWQRLIYKQADSFNFKKVIKLDFNELTNNWAAAGKKINNWDWDLNPKLMRLGMTASWDSVSNIEEVLSWIPDLTLAHSIKGEL